MGTLSKLKDLLFGAEVPFKIHVAELLVGLDDSKNRGILHASLTHYLAHSHLMHHLQVNEVDSLIKRPVPGAVFRDTTDPASLIDNTSLKFIIFFKCRENIIILTSNLSCAFAFSASL